MILKDLKRTFFTTGLVALCIAFLSFAGLANALEIVLEPSSLSREINDEFRVQIYADPTVDLISMGVKISYDPGILQVVSAAKYEDFDNGWIMDADGDPGTTGDQYTSPAVEISDPAGSVTMIGGRLIGSTTTGLSDKVLLGWIVFRAIAIGTSNLEVDLARYNLPPQTFDNFVQVDGAVDEPTNVPGDLGTICVVNDACRGDLNNDGAVNFLDLGLFRSDFARPDCGDPGMWCAGDMNDDGAVNFLDLGLFRSDFNRPDCPLCN